MKSSQDLSSLSSEYREFIASFQTVLIASTSVNNTPEASYAPYIHLNGQYYLFISELAVHTKNLLQTKVASLLFIENEADAKNLFARQRISLQCSAAVVAKDSAEYQAALQLFHERFGKFMQLLQSLPDFHLFCLSPSAGNYVAGFGKAYSLTGSDLTELQHRNPEAGNVRPS
jgi:hypothetical protein